MDALIKAASDPINYRYSLCDMKELLEAVADWYQNRYGVHLELDEITSVHGTQEGVAHIAFPLCDPGDTVLVPDPGYPIFGFGAFLAGAHLVTIPLKAENDFLIDFDSIEGSVADSAKYMVVSYPSNPATATATPEFYERLVHFAKKHDLIVIHDNAYSELVFEGRPGMSFLAVPGAKDVGIEFNSLSKSYNLTGCRISFALGNTKIVERFKTLRTQIDYGMFYPIQYAAIAALRGPQDILARNRRGYLERRNALCGGLTKIGWDVPNSKATMFVWARLPKGYHDSVQFVLELMEKTGVIAVPGSSFGTNGEGYIRFALVVPPEQMERAVNKIAQSGIVHQYE